MAKQTDAKRKAKKKAYNAERYANFTPEQKAEKLIRQAKRRANLTPEQIAEDKTYNTERCANLTPEQRNRVKASGAKWKKNNPGSIREYQIKRDTQKGRTEVSWLTDAHKALIKLIYHLRDVLNDMTSPGTYHVDHVMPLQGEDVTGLNLPVNMRVITASANLSKGNRYDPEEVNVELLNPGSDEALTVIR